jgi:restriction system protein
MSSPAALISALRRYVVRQRFAAQRSLDDMRALTWQQFETIVGEAFRRQGYSVIETGQGGADGGVDLELTRAGERFLVQCKQYRAQDVSVMTVREIFGVVAARKADGAIVVSTGRFTNDALESARGQPIRLIDGCRLEAMVRDIKVVVGAPAPGGGTRREPTINASSPSSAGDCPKCGSTMVRRTREWAALHSMAARGFRSAAARGRRREILQRRARTFLRAAARSALVDEPHHACLTRSQ